MPLSSDIIGRRTEPVFTRFDVRWAMNYAASIDDWNSKLYDTRSESLPVHPMILAYPEWEASKLLRDQQGLDDHEASRAVQITQDLRVYRPLRVEEDIQSVAQVIGVERHRAGAWMTVQHDHRTNDGELVASSLLGAIYRDVEVTGGDHRPQTPALPAESTGGSDDGEFLMDLSPAACHIYSECARIYNPFHTDIKVAEAGGISGLILHGTATIARAVSGLTTTLIGGDVASIARIHAQLQAMVFVPSKPTVHFDRCQATDSDERVIRFGVRTETGQPAIAKGLLVHRQP